MRPVIIFLTATLLQFGVSTSRATENGAEESCIRTTQQNFLSSVLPSDIDMCEKLLMSLSNKPDFLFSLARLYHRRNDFAKAYRHYLDAASFGHVNAQNNLGLLLLDGLGVEKDIIKAISLFRSAADAGSHFAMYNLASVLSKQKQIRPQANEIINLLKKSAIHNSFAQAELGVMYSTGSGVTRDDVIAVTYLRKAAEAGHREAQYNLGKMYLENRGCLPDCSNGRDLILQSAEAGLPMAQNDIGAYLSVGKIFRKDSAEAVTWFMKSANQKFPTAMVNLGVMYGRGDGVPKDLEKAIYFIRSAAQMGSSIGQYQLGLAYYHGNGVPRDHREAFSWIKKAAENELVAAQRSLALLYQKGEGVNSSASQAETWLKRAADKGDENSKAILYDIRTAKFNSILIGAVGMLLAMSLNDDRPPTSTDASSILRERHEKCQSYRQQALMWEAASGRSLGFAHSFGC